ncbi:MAG: ATP-dependent Clp protease proteolytic subunit [Bacteroidales bacterium]
MTDLKNIVGAVREGAPATIQFYGEVNEWNCAYFNYEFMWLMSQKPSKINIMINSEGGSVIHGMGTYAIIQDCEIETECIISGLAASMGSILWAAGDSRKMRDYSILMIHNPYYDGGEDDSMDPALAAFTKQLRSVYKSKFGLSEDDVKKIMDGKSGEDGTWLDYSSAIKHGIIGDDDVIKTSKGKCKKMKNLLSAKASVKDIVANVTKELIDEQPKEVNTSNIKTEENEISNKQKMANLTALASLLGLPTEATQEDVFAKIPELMKAKSDFDSVNAKLDAEVKAKQELEIKLAGETAKVTQISDKLKTAEASLKEYQEKEEAAHKEAIEKEIQNAIDEGRIPEDTKDMWIAQATVNLDLVKKTLNSIPKADKISDAIKKDEKQTREASKNVNEQLQAKVAEAVGADFKFKTFEN